MELNMNVRNRVFEMSVDGNTKKQKINMRNFQSI